MGGLNKYGVIYCLTCQVNGKVYIGETINFDKRMVAYKTLQCKGQPHIYNALKSHGVENFLYEIIDYGISQSDLNELEKYHMALSKSQDREYGYNTRGGGGARGRHSEESKRKNSDAHKGKNKSPWSEDTKKKRAEWRLLNPVTQETRNKLSEKGKGRKHTEEAKIKMAETKKGNTIWKGRKHSPETKAKMSSLAKGRKATEETKEILKQRWKERKAKLALDKSLIK